MNKWHYLCSVALSHGTPPNHNADRIRRPTTNIYDSIGHGPIKNDFTSQSTWKLPLVYHINDKRRCHAILTTIMRTIHLSVLCRQTGSAPCSHREHGVCVSCNQCARVNKATPRSMIGRIQSQRVLSSAAPLSRHQANALETPVHCANPSALAD